MHAVSILGNGMDPRTQPFLEWLLFQEEPKMDSISLCMNAVIQVSDTLSLPPHSLLRVYSIGREANPNFDVEIRDDVIEECNKHGGVFHIFVDKASPQGNVYVKCPSIASAVASVNALHGRWFAGT